MKKNKKNKVKTARFRTLPIVICLCAVIFSLKVEGLWDNVKLGENKEKKEISAVLVNEAKAQESTEHVVQGSPTERVDVTSTAIMANMVNPDIPSFSEEELLVLQSLAKRREELELRERELGMKIATINAAEMQIDIKLKKLRELEEEIKRLVGLYDENERDKLNSLVRIYSNMKPKDAARIFNDLDMDILIKVFSQMKDSSAAGIMALMEPARANALTVELANKNRPDFLNSTR